MVRTASSIAVALALGSAAAMAAPTTSSPTSPGPGVTKAPVPGECPTPTVEVCMSKSYLASVCPQYQGAECRGLLNPKLEAFYTKSGAPELQMLRPKRTEIPADVRKGKYFAYAPKKSFKAVTKKLATTWAKKTKIATIKKTGTFVNMQPVGGMALDLPRVYGEPPVDRVTRVMVETAAKAHRQPGWDANGGKIAACPEYGYEANYDITQFIDAAAACRGDLECIYQVAYLPANPGIARRDLKDKDGTKLANQMKLVKGKFPKNDLFSTGSGFLFKNGFEGIPSTPDLEALKAVLDAGRTAHRSGVRSACDRHAVHHARAADGARGS